jgi:predicted RNase H-like HicB family nuclease
MIVMTSFTICYTRIETGYMGQLLEWPEVINEGSSIEGCRSMVEDAAREMIAVYQEDGLPIPQGHAIFETISILEPDSVCQPA